MPFFHFHQGPSGGGGDRGGGVSMPLPETVSTEFKLLDPAKLALRRNGCRLEVREDGAAEFIEAAAFRLFPLSESDGWISIIDTKGREVGIIRRLADLSPEARAAVDEELARRYLVPEILRIISAHSRFEIVQFEVETDRGPRQVVVHDLRESIKRRGLHGFTIYDAHGSRYEIPDLRSLDARSRTMLERYL